MRILVTHPPDPRPVLTVETVAQIDEPAIARLKKAMHDRGCSNGLLFDANVCLILKDSYTSLDPSSIIVDDRVDTGRVLARIDERGSLEQRVMDWLRAMSASWSDTLPQADVAAPFLTDIVLAVSGSSIRQVS